MNKKYLLAGYRLAFATLVVVAILAQLVHSSRTIPGFSGINFLSFFTIESNIFGGAVFLVSAKAALLGTRNGVLDNIRGAATLYMATTGVVYVLLLSNVDVQVPLPWVNAVLHYIFPIVILLDWILDKPSHKMSFYKSLWWLAFPLAYLAYSLVRGAFVHWYPYPFIDVETIGYAKVALYSLAVAIIAVGFDYVIAKIPHVIKSR